MRVCLPVALGTDTPHKAPRAHPHTHPHTHPRTRTQVYRAKETIEEEYKRLGLYEQMEGEQVRGGGGACMVFGLCACRLCRAAYCGYGVCIAKRRVMHVRPPTRSRHCVSPFLP